MGVSRFRILSSFALSLALAGSSIASGSCPLGGLASPDIHAEKEASLDSKGTHDRDANPDLVPQRPQDDLPVTNLVFAGAGDVVDRFWGPALKDRIDSERGKRHFVITFVDNSSYYKNNPELKMKMEGILAEKMSWAGPGVEIRYIDLANPAEAEKQLGALKHYKLAVTTPDRFHMQTVESFLNRKNPPDEVFVEKPVDSDVKKAEAMLARLRKDGIESKVFAVDHYRASLTADQVKRIKEHVGPIKRIAFYLLEDHSGADPKYQSNFKARDGAIEVEARNKALIYGLIPDLFSHGPPQVGLLGQQETIVPTSVKPLKYVGVDHDPNKPAQIKGETFAAIEFTMKGDDGQLIPCVAYVGKDIRGVKAMGPEFDGDVSVMDVEGKNGRHVRVAADGPNRGQGQMWFYDGDKAVKSEPLPKLRYRPIIDAMMDDNSPDRFPLMPFKLGVSTAQVVKQAHDPVRQLPTLPTYQGGMSSTAGSLGHPGSPGRQAPYLENVLQTPGARWVPVPPPAVDGSQVP